MAAEVFKGAGQEDSIGALPRAGPLLHVGRGVRHPGLDHAAHPPLPRHRLRAADAADEPGHHRGGHPRSTTRCGRRRSPASSISRSATPSTRRRARCCSCRCRRELRQEVKPFVDVTVDRMARGARRAADPGADPAVGPRPAVESAERRQPGARRWSWFFMAVRAKREYLASFRRSIEQRIVQPEQVRLDAADLSTVETLVQELAHPDAERVRLRDRRARIARQAQPGDAAAALSRVAEGPGARAAALAASRSETTRAQWAPQHPAAARRSGCRRPRRRRSPRSARSATRTPPSLARPMLADDDPRIRATAAAALPTSTRPDDLDARRSGARRPHRRHLGRRAARPARRRRRHPADSPTRGSGGC